MNIFRNNSSPVRRNVARKSTSHRPLKNNLINEDVISSFETNTTDTYFEGFSRCALNLNKTFSEKNGLSNNVSMSVLTNTYCNELSFKSPDPENHSNRLNGGGTNYALPLPGSDVLPFDSRVEESETVEIDGVFTASSGMLSYLQDSILSPTVSQDSSDHVIDSKLVINYPKERDSLDCIKQSNKRNGFLTSPMKKCDKDFGEPMLLRIKSSEGNGKDKSETGESDIVVIVGNRMIQQCELVTATVHNDQSKDVPVKMIVCHTLSENCDQGEVSQDDHTYEGLDDPVDSNFLKVLCVQTLADSSLGDLEGEHQEKPIEASDETRSKASSPLPTNIKSKKRKSRAPKVFFGTRKKKKKSTDISPESSVLQKNSSSSDASFEDLPEIDDRSVTVADQDPESTSETLIITKRITRSSAQSDVGKDTAVCKVSGFKEDADISDLFAAGTSPNSTKKYLADVKESISAVKPPETTKKDETNVQDNIPAVKSSKATKKEEFDVEVNILAAKPSKAMKKEFNVKEISPAAKPSKATKKEEFDVKENIPAVKPSKSTKKEEFDVKENIPAVKPSKATKKEEVNVKEIFSAVKPSKATKKEGFTVEENITALRSSNATKSKPDIKQVAATKGIMLLSDSNKEVAVIQQGSTVINDKDALLKLNPSKIDYDTLSAEVEETDVDIQQSLTEEILLEQAMRLARLRTSPRRKPIMTKYEERRLVKSILDSLPQKKKKRITRGSQRVSEVIHETEKQESITDENITREGDRTSIIENISDKDSAEDSSIIEDEKAAKPNTDPPKRKKRKTTINKKKKYVKKETFENNSREIVEKETVTNVVVLEEMTCDAIQCNIVESTEQLSLDICDSSKTVEVGSPVENPPVVDSSKEDPGTVNLMESEPEPLAEPDIPFISSSTKEKTPSQGLESSDRQTTALSVPTDTYVASPDRPMYPHSHSPVHVPQYNIPLTVPLVSSPLPAAQSPYLQQLAPNRPLYVGIPFSSQCSVSFKGGDSTQISPVAHQNMSPRSGVQLSPSRSDGSLVSHLVGSSARSDSIPNALTSNMIHDVPLSILVRDPRLKRRSALLATPPCTNPSSDQQSVHRAVSSGTLPVRSHPLLPLPSTPQNVIPLPNQVQSSVPMSSSRLPVQSQSLLPFPSAPLNVVPLMNQAQPIVSMSSGRLPIQSNSLLFNHNQPITSSQQNISPTTNQLIDFRSQDIIVKDKVPLPLMSLPVEPPSALKNKLLETFQDEIDDDSKDEFKGKYISPERRKIKKKMDDDPELQYKTPLSDLHDLPERTSSYSRTFTKKSASKYDPKVRDYKSPRRKESTDTNESLSEEAIQSEQLDMSLEERPSSWSSAHYPILGRLSEMRRPEGNEANIHENENRRVKEYSRHSNSEYPPAYLRSQDFQQSAVKHAKEPTRSAYISSEQFLNDKRRSGEYSNVHRPEDYRRYSDHSEDVIRKEEYRMPDEYASSYRRPEELSSNWSREYSPEGRKMIDEHVRDSRWSEGYSSDYRRSKEYRIDTRREVRAPEGVLQEMSRTEEESFVRKRERSNEDSSYPRYDYAHKRVEGRFPADASCWKDSERERHKRSDRQYDSESRESRWDEDSDVRDLIDGPLTFYRRKQRFSSSRSSSWKPGELFERRGGSGSRSEEDERHKPRKRPSSKSYRDRDYLREPSPSSLESPMSPEPEFVPYQEPIICLSTPQ